MKFIIGNFFLPRQFSVQRKKTKHRAAVIVPSFQPGELTVALIDNLLRWNKNILLYVVDDSTPAAYEAEHRIFARLRALSPRVKILRTPENKMKAGAINHALSHILNQKNNSLPEAIITLDDDVVISQNTIKNLVNNLFEDDLLGAVCSQCRVMNKNKNFLTRLQGLEYLGFNGARLADEGFFRGPLVMHGMLAAFRTQALQDVGLFAERHLIEDYEITARIKKRGWHVRLAPDAYAWTQVPENFRVLWRQRTRWMVGGLFVVSDFRYWRAVVQDLVGHVFFLSTFLFVIASFLLRGSPGSIPYIIPIAIILISFTQALVWYLFQVWFMRFYLEKDWKDWLIRLTLIPEFIYANILAIVLLGSYVFFVFQALFSWPGRKSKILARIKVALEKIFSWFGYTRGWGTRQQQKLE